MMLMSVSNPDNNNNSLEINALVDQNITKYYKEYEDIHKNISQHLHDDIDNLIKKNEKRIYEQQIIIENRSDIFLKALKDIIEHELKNYHRDVIIHLENADELEKINLMTFFQGFKNILISLFGESFRGIIENHELERDLHQIWNNKINYYSDEFKKKFSTSVCRGDHTEPSTKAKTEHTTDDMNASLTGSKKRADDEDEYKIPGLKKSKSINELRSGKNGLETTEPNLKSKDKVEEKGKSKVLEFVKGMFTGKKTLKDPDAPTKMILDESKKFFYDPVKQRYIFEGEENAPEEDVPLPPKMVQSVSDLKEEKKEDIPKPVEEKQVLESHDLLKPPSRLPMNKKKGSKKPLSQSLIQPGFVPQQMLAPISSSNEDMPNRLDMSEPVLSLNKTLDEIAFMTTSKREGSSIGLVEEYRLEMINLIKKFKIEVSVTDFDRLNNIIKDNTIRQAHQFIEFNSHLELITNQNLRLFESDYNTNLQNVLLKSIVDQTNSKNKGQSGSNKILSNENNNDTKVKDEFTIDASNESSDNAHAKNRSTTSTDNIYKLIYEIKSTVKLDEQGYEMNKPCVYYNRLNEYNSVFSKLLNTCEEYNKLKDDFHDLQLQHNTLKGRYELIKSHYTKQDLMVNNYKNMIKRCNENIVKKDKLLLEFKEEKYKMEMSLIEKELQLMNKQTKLTEVTTNFINAQNEYKYNISEYENKLRDLIIDNNEQLLYKNSIITELELKINEMKDNTDNLNIEYFNLDLKYNDLHNKHNTLVKSNEDLQEKYESLLIEYKRFEEEQSILKNGYEAHLNSIKVNFEKQIEDYNKEIANINEKYEQINGELSKYIEKNQILADEKNKTIEELNQTIENLKQQNKDLTADVQKILSIITIFSEKIMHSLPDISVKKLDILSEENIHHNEEIYNHYTSILTKLHEGILTLFSDQKKHNESDRQKYELERQNYELGRQKHELEHERMMNEIETLKHEKSAYENEIARYKELEYIHEEELKELKIKYDNVELDNLNLKGENMDYKNHVDALNDELSKNQMILSNYEKELNNAIEEKEELNKQIEEYAEKYERILMSNEELIQSCNKNPILEQYKNELDQMRIELLSKEQDYKNQINDIEIVHQQQIFNLKENIASKEEECQEKEKKIQEASKMIDSITKEKDSFLLVVEELKNNLDTAKKNLEEAIISKQELDDRFNANENLIMEQQHQIDDLQNENSHLKSALDELKQSFEIEAINYKNILDSNTSQISELQTEITELKKSNSNLIEKLTQNEEEFIRQNERYDELVSRYNSLEIENLALGQKNKEYLDEINELKSFVNSKADNKDEAQGPISLDSNIYPEESDRKDSQLGEEIKPINEESESEPNVISSEASRTKSASMIPIEREINLQESINPSTQVNELNARIEDIEVTNEIPESKNEILEHPNEVPKEELPLLEDKQHEKTEEKVIDESSRKGQPDSKDMFDIEQIKLMLSDSVNHQFYNDFIEILTELKKDNLTKVNEILSVLYKRLSELLNNLIKSKDEKEEKALQELFEKLEEITNEKNRLLEIIDRLEKEKANDIKQFNELKVLYESKSTKIVEIHNELEQNKQLIQTLKRSKTSSESTFGIEERKALMDELVITRTKAENSIVEMNYEKEKVKKLSQENEYLKKENLKFNEELLNAKRRYVEIIKKLSIEIEERESSGNKQKAKDIQPIKLDNTILSSSNLDENKSNNSSIMTTTAGDRSTNLLDLILPKVEDKKSEGIMSPTNETSAPKKRGFLNSFTNLFSSDR